MSSVIYVQTVQTKKMRRLIYDMFYADEISEDVAYKLIDKLNKIRDKTKYSWER